MNHEKSVGRQQRRRRFRVRRLLHGTARRPRLSVFRSHKHIYCQVIDDDAGRTLVSASTREGQLRSSLQHGGNKEAAALVGKAIARKAVDAGIKQVCFDRGQYQFHGRVAALAAAAREEGLEF